MVLSYTFKNHDFKTFFMWYDVSHIGFFRFHFQHLGRGERRRICGAKYIERGNLDKDFVMVALTQLAG